LSIPTLITFIIYFVFLLGIGFYFYRKSVNIGDYLLGGRGMGSWVTALSAQASDMSGWLLMGLPGAIYLAGLEKSWIAIGLFIGTVLNWKLVSARLRVYTQRTNTITLPCFFEQRFGDPTGLLRVVSAIITLIFFTIYASSGLVAAGKLFESTFHLHYTSSVLLGGSIIIIYTFMGGFLAVCWTDLFQGSLMLIAIVVVPAIAYFKLDGGQTAEAAASLKVISLNSIPDEGGFSIFMIISMMGWGLGYFGQPHILARFMSAKSVRKLRDSMAIAIVWVFLSLGAAVVVGLVGRMMFEGLNGGDQEKVFIYMIEEVMHPWLAGIMLAAILSAIMSTIDSQLLVSSSALTEDFYEKAINKKATQKESMLVGRICVMIISFIALVLALSCSVTILDIVAYAWGGLGASFGPVVLFALFSRKTSWQSVLAGMVTGAVTVIIWKQSGLGEYMYELVPGFTFNCFMLIIFNRSFQQNNKRVLGQFDSVVRQVNKQQGPDIYREGER